MQVEAMPDADGLKVAIVTGVVRETQELAFQLFKCKNETEFGLTSIQGDNLKTFGGARGVGWLWIPRPCFPVLFRVSF